VSGSERRRTGPAFSGAAGLLRVGTVVDQAAVIHGGTDLGVLHHRSHPPTQPRSAYLFVSVRSCLFVAYHCLAAAAELTAGVRVGISPLPGGR